MILCVLFKLKLKISFINLIAKKISYIKGLNIQKGEIMKKCTTCNKIVYDKKTEFKCPSCGKETIIRCDSCKKSSKEYSCKECGFIGP